MIFLTWRPSLNSRKAGIPPPGMLLFRHAKKNDTMNTPKWKLLEDSIHVHLITWLDCWKACNGMGAVASDYNIEKRLPQPMPAAHQANYIQSLLRNVKHLNPGIPLFLETLEKNQWICLEQFNNLRKPRASVFTPKSAGTHLHTIGWACEIVANIICPTTNGVWRTSLT